MAPILPVKTLAKNNGTPTQDWQEGRTPPLYHIFAIHPNFLRLLLVYTKTTPQLKSNPNAASSVPPRPDKLSVTFREPGETQIV